MYKIINNILKIIFIFIAIVAGIFSYAYFIEPETLVVEKVEINSIFIDESASNITIAVISDTHFSNSYDIDDFQKVLDSLSENNADIVLFSGDLIDNYEKYNGSIEDISESLASIYAPIGKYAVFGNHDYGGGAEKKYSDILKDGGFQVLKNEYLSLDEYKISIIGIDDFMLGYGDISKATWARDDFFNILLCHEPDIIERVLEYNIDLMIAGHTHGGQIHIPGYTEKFLPPYGEKYIKGLYNFENSRSTSLYVNPGLGTTQLSMRFLSKPEITYITLI